MMDGLICLSIPDAWSWELPQGGWPWHKLLFAIYCCPWIPSLHSLIVSFSSLFFCLHNVTLSFHFTGDGYGDSLVWCWGNCLICVCIYGTHNRLSWCWAVAQKCSAAIWSAEGNKRCIHVHFNHQWVGTEAHSWCGNTFSDSSSTAFMGCCHSPDLSVMCPVVLLYYKKYENNSVSRGWMWAKGECICKNILV